MDSASDAQRMRQFIFETLPPVPELFDYVVGKDTVSESLQERIDTYLSLKQTGVHFNQRLASNKEFRNPNIYMKLLEYAHLDEYASNIEKSVYDLSRLPKSASYKALNERQREEHNKRQQQPPPS